MSTEIYYFSGTGNSLLIAKELQKRIDGSRLIPIVSLLDKKAVQTKGKTVGFVFPVHALTIPIAVKKFIRRTDFTSAEYLFAVATREGTIFRGFEKMNRLLGKKKKQLSAHFILNMYNNESRHEGYKVPTEEDLELLKEAAFKKLDSIQEVVRNQWISREKDTEYLVGFDHHPVTNFLLEKTVLAGMDISEYIGGVNYFYRDSRCTGCGICERVCLSRKIKMMDGKPFWQKKILCYMCFACLNYCPAKSVQIKDIPGVKSYSAENGRYPHPYATIKDISVQKGE